MGNKNANKRVTARRMAGLLATLGILVMSSGVALMVTATPANAAKIHKSYVCKWVKTPGTDTEVLQTGQNPIWVDNDALGVHGPTVVGQEFNDGQVRSVVIVANTAKLHPEPGIDACTGETAPPSIDQANASATFVDPTCAAPSIGSVTTSADQASVVVSPDQASYAIGDSVTVTATADQGAAFDDGVQTQWTHTFAASDGDCSTTTVVDPPKTPTKHHTKTQSTVVTPTVVHAGLTGTTVEDMRGEQGLALMFAGMLMMVAAGGLGLRVRGVASRI